MFFTRLRRRAKWVFLALAVVFALGFVGFGVGAGGSGIGDYLSDLVRGRPTGSGSPSIDDARGKLQENPNDVEARKELATALQTAGRTDEALTELERYTEARPKDADALQQLASLYSVKAQQQRQELQAIRAAPSGSSFSQDLNNPSSPLSSDLSGGPITELEQQGATTRTNQLVTETQTTYSREADVYKTLTGIRPGDAALYLQLGQASFFSGDVPEAITAWKRFLKLAPDDPNAALIKRQLRVLEGGTGG